jgi:hypothetical protein
MDEAGYRVSRFLLVQTLVNSAFGLTIGVALYTIGLPNAALWGGIAAMLRFIPYLGTAIAAILPLALAFAVDPGWHMLFWTAGVFVALEMIVGNMVEPFLYGSSTGLSAVALVVSAIFWTWLWGTIGLLLATPLTVCIAVIGRYVPQLAFLEVLLGNQAPLLPEESFYQRLLAGDPDEAAGQGEEFVKSRTLLEFYDQVAMPALILAERDRTRGEFDDQHLTQVAAGIRIVTENLAPDPPKSGRGLAKDEAPDAASPPCDLVLCVAGRTELDEAAACLLAQLLEQNGRRALTLPFQSAVKVLLPGADPASVKIVCMSYLDPESAPQARYLARRLRRLLGPDIGIVVGLWGVARTASERDAAKTETRADHVVGTVAEAIDAVAAVEAGGPRTAMPEPGLDELAARISAAMSRTA